MSNKNIEIALKKVFGHEGGYTNNRNDRGNWTSGKIGVGELKGTKYGIAAHAFPHLDIKNLTIDQAADIYRRQYWAPIRADDLPQGIDYMVFDFAVNSGVSRAARFLQRALNVEFGAGLKTDGIIGEITLRAVNSLTKRQLIDLVELYSSKRLAFKKRLKGWKHFGRGWTRRVKEVRSDAIQMIKDRPDMSDLLVKRDVNAPHGGPDAQEIRKSKTPGGQAVIGTGLGAVGVAASEAADQIAPLADFSDTLRVVFIGLTVLGVAASLYLAWTRSQDDEDGEWA